MAKLFDDWYDWVNPYRYGQAVTRPIKSAGRAVGKGVGDYFAGPARAARDQRDAANKGLDAQERMFDKSLATQKPWLEVGEKHLRSLSDMVSGGQFDVDPGNFQSRSFTPEKFDFNFEADPGYQFRLQQGLGAVENSAAARGGLKSGATMKALSDYGQGMASHEYGNAFNRAYGQYSDNYARDYGRFSDQYSRDYGAFHDNFNRRMAVQGNRFNQMAGMAGIGQTAAGNVSSMSMQQGQNLASAYNNIGNARANQSMSMQNTINPLINTAAQGLGAYYGAR